MAEVAPRRDVREVAGELLALAEHEARARAMSALVERRTSELLAAAEQLVAGEPSQQQVEDAGQTHVDVAPAHPSEASGVCMHAIAWAAAAASLDVVGLDGVRAARAVGSGQIVAIISDVDAALFDGLDAAAMTSDSRIATFAQRHDDIVFEAARRATVLPLRFGSVLRDEHDVEALLGEHEATLRARLEALAGLWEWTCRLSCDDAIFRRRVAELEPAPAAEAAAGDGARYLASRSAEKRVRETARRLQGEAVQHVSRICGEFAEASVGIPSAGSLHSIAMLMSEALVEPLHTSLESLATELAPLGFAIDVRGPLPPYHFVHDVIAPAT